MTLRPNFRYAGAFLLNSTPVVRDRRSVYSAQQRKSAACLQVMCWGGFMLPPVSLDSGAVLISSESGRYDNSSYFFVGFVVSLNTKASSGCFFRRRCIARQVVSLS